MSAWIMDPINIDAMVQCLGRAQEPLYICDGFRLDPKKREDLERAGQILTDENYRSVNFRYDEEAQTRAYRYKRTYTFTPVVILKLLACYEYQACEAPDYEQSTACKLVAVIRKEAIKRLAGYDNAPWGMDESYRVIRRGSPEDALIEGCKELQAALF